MRKNCIAIGGCILCVLVGMKIGGRAGQYREKGVSQISDCMDEKLSVPVESRIKNIEECYLCGSSNQSLMDVFRRYDDLGIICVNNWYVMDMGIRNHDEQGNLAGEQRGFCIGWTNTEKGDCSFQTEGNPDRGISNVTVEYGENSVFDVKRVQDYLCQECLDKLLAVMKIPYGEYEPEKVRDVCLVDFQTLELYSLQEHRVSYYIRDYYVQMERQETKQEITAFYAPVLKNGHKPGE